MVSTGHASVCEAPALPSIVILPSVLRALEPGSSGLSVSIPARLSVTPGAGRSCGAHAHPGAPCWRYVTIHFRTAEGRGALVKAACVQLAVARKDERRIVRCKLGIVRRARGQAVARASEDVGAWLGHCGHARAGAKRRRRVGGLGVARAQSRRPIKPPPLAALRARPLPADFLTPCRPTCSSRYPPARPASDW